MLKCLSSMLCTSKIHPFSLGNHLGTSFIIENLMRIRVTSVEWTCLGLKCPLAQYVALYSWLYSITSILWSLLHSCSLQFCFVNLHTITTNSRLVTTISSKHGLHTSHHNF